MADKSRSAKGRGSTADRRVAQQFAAQMAAEAARRKKEEQRLAREAYLAGRPRKPPPARPRWSNAYGTWTSFSPPPWPRRLHPSTLRR
jgi:hypothetical protein